MRYIISLIGLAFAPTVAHAQSLSGKLGINSKYLDDDGFVYTDEPVAQGSLSLEIMDDLTLEAWGSHGVTTTEGAELDIGVSYSIDIAKNTELNLSAQRNFLIAQEDITELTVGVTHGPIEVAVSYYAWDKNPDALRAVASYTIAVSKSTELRPLLVYETGFGEPDIFAAGLSAKYRLTDKLSLVGTAIAPINSGSGRTVQASIGISFEF